MQSQPTYRGLPFQMTSFETIDLDRQAIFLGRTANIVSPIKSRTVLFSDIQFLGRRPISPTITNCIESDLEGLVPA